MGVTTDTACFPRLGASCGVAPAPVCGRELCGAGAAVPAPELGETRQAFSGDAEPGRLFLEVRSLAPLSASDAASLVGLFNAQGAAIVRCREGPLDQQVALTPLLGRPCDHKFGGDDGRRVIQESPEQGSATLAATSLEFQPHTDGTYDDEPNEVLSLFCECAAPEGGESLLVSGAALLRDLLRRLPAAAWAPLFHPECLTVKASGRQRAGPVLSLDQASGRIRLRFRCDDFARNQYAVRPEARRAFGELVAATQDRANQLEVALKPGDLLLVDNTGMLHGRRAFRAASGGEASRRMIRMNFHVAGQGGKLAHRLHLGVPLSAVPGLVEFPVERPLPVEPGPATSAEA